MRRVFLSYREAEAEYAERLRKQLIEMFGDDCVAGSPEEADAVLAFIGPGSTADDRGEVAAALADGKLVIPVLCGGAALPNDGPLADNYPLEIPEPASAFDAEAVARQLTEVIHPLAAAGNGGGGAHAEAPTTSADRPLAEILSDAARAGVVPAASFAPAPAPAPAPAYEPEPEYLPPPTQALPKERGGLLRIALPAVLVGAGLLVVAKWLLGWFVTDAEVSASPDEVVCTVFAPPSAAPGDAILVQAFAHLPEQADDARAIATELDTDAQRRAFQSLAARVPRGSRLDFELRMPGLDVDEPVASLVWNGRPEAVQFGVQIPADAREGSVIGTLDVSLDGAPLGHVKFKLAVARAAAPAASEPQGENARRYTNAFISYASADRAQVLARVQMLSVAGVSYFQDVLSLEPGDRWAKKLELGIDECDVFLLFWSNNAKESKWVRKEVAYALERSGGNELHPPEIRPVILEGPPVVKPWEELAHLHFNDKLMYFMRPPGAG